MNSDFKCVSVSHTKLSLLQKTLYIVHKPYVDCMIDRYYTFMWPSLKKILSHNNVTTIIIKKLHCVFL